MKVKIVKFIQCEPCSKSGPKFPKILVLELSYIAIMHLVFVTFIHFMYISTNFFLGLGRNHELVQI